MSIPVPQRKSFEMVPSGSHVARCYQVIHIGTIPEEYQGEHKHLNKVRIGFELPLEMREFNEGEEKKPMSISREFTLSLGDKSNLKKFVEGMCGEVPEDFDVESLIGKECLITIVHKSKSKGGQRADMTTASPLPKGMECPPAINKPKILNFDNFDHELFMSLPDFLKDKIRSSLEYKKLFSTDPVDKGDIPF